MVYFRHYCHWPVLCNDPSHSPFSVPHIKGVSDNTVKWLRLCTRHVHVSSWAAFQAWDSQRQRFNFQNPSEARMPRGYTLCKLDTLWIIAVCSAPRETQSHQPQAPGQICNRSLNSPKPRVRLGDFFICPFNTSTAHRTWIQRSIFPKFQIFRLWLLVSSTVNTAKVYQKIKYYCLSSWPFITE